jgi:GNAT superfamily N-acetyltransferase
MQPSLNTSRAPARRILVVANETAAGAVLHEAIRFRARVDTEVLVVAPALNTRLRHWLSDEDLARRSAEARLVRCLDRLAAVGIDAHGMVGDADPVQAIADSLYFFRADEIVIATHPEARSHWLSRKIVTRARERFGLPVGHVVVSSADSLPSSHSSFPDRSQAVLKPR